MDIVDTAYAALEHLEKSELVLSQTFLNQTLEAKKPDPFLALKLIPPLCRIISLIDHKEPCLKKLEQWYQVLCENIPPVTSPLLLARMSLACSLAKEYIPNIQCSLPTLEIQDFFNPSGGYDLFPLVFFQKGDHYQKIKEELINFWDAPKGFFKGPALYSRHRGLKPVFTGADLWMQRFFLKNKGVADPAIAFFKDNSLCLEPYWRGFHLVRAFLGDSSFSVQGKIQAQVVSEDEMDLSIHFTYPALLLEYDPWALIGFYIDRQAEFSINGQKASSFCLGDEVSFAVPGFIVTVQFIRKTGKARIHGHVMPYQRPAQEEEFSGSDWAVFLRPVSVEEESTFKMMLKVKRA